MSRFLWDWSKIIGVTMGAVGLAIKGELAPVVAAILIALYAMVRGAARGSGGITKTLFWFLEIVFIILLFAGVFAEAGNVVGAISSIIGLFSAAIAWIAKLVTEGYLSIFHGVFFIIAFAILEHIGLWIADIKVHEASKTALRIFLPIAMLAAFMVLYVRGNIWGVLGQLMTLFLLLYAFYLIAFGWSSSRRK